MSLFLLPVYYLILIIIILIIFYNFYWKRRNLPDGPIPLPIIGNVIEISKADRRYKCFEDWTKKYGPVYTIWVDGDSYVDRDFLTKHFTIYFGSVDGVNRSNGEQWKQLRKFFFKAMRDYGIDKDTVEKHVLDAIFRVIDKTKKEKQEGKKEHSIDRQVDLMTDIEQVIRHIPIYVKQFYNKGKWATKKIFEYLKIEIDKRIEKRKNPNYVAEEGMDETTSNTINFMILYLMLDQNSQNKLQKELDQVMEEKRKLAKESGEEFNEVFYQSDRPKLNYTNAVTNETQRLSNLLPLNLTRKVNKDVKIGGHNIKSGTLLIPQISTVLFNEKIFPEPEKFIPERFLDENGQFKRIEKNIPFSVGKRSCAGEALARMELFLFSANFFYKFHVYPPNPLNPPKHEKGKHLQVSGKLVSKELLKIILKNFFN
ncbi:hypothetical protein Mgra_00009304 [Meloidogyne graminicola]|uniref:Cytochrome P450 n=1 Tax=Meloidogyne graminicola TaxID=189291 RepID=A0A8S9ZDD3_9BILA|nr:hypothetical protein Mgra_00009304 [Meloidogyne graminicola]